jgi:hypothetical protein
MQKISFGHFFGGAPVKVPAAAAAAARRQFFLGGGGVA